VFIPEGTYRISKTIYVPPAVRLIGYGGHRPTIVLAAGSPGFAAADPADKGQARYMFWFTGEAHRAGQAGKPVSDANPGTFYSGISNIDLRIEDGNPAAVALRTHFAQHGIVSHVDIDIGQGKAGVFDVGNEMQDVRFFGGEYGILTTKPSPGWPFMMLDTVFEGQRRAAIRTREAGLTIVRMQARHVPTVIEVEEGMPEKLILEDSRFEDVKGPALLVSADNNAFTQVNVRGLDCRNVPLLMHLRDSGRDIAAPASIYHVASLVHGQQMDSLADKAALRTTQRIEPLAALPKPVKSDIPDLPTVARWTSVRDAGARGDGTTDDTQAIQAAIDKHPVVYFPAGRYRVSDTLRLKPDTVLIGLHPGLTQLRLPNGSPLYQGVGTPKALIESAKGGDAIVTGIGINTGEVNPRATGLLWRAGARSLVDDIRVQWGMGAPGDPYKKTERADTSAWWDRQYPSIWVTDGGGGTFTGLWSPAGHAQAGFYVTNTTTPGRVYELSAEHHIRNEIVLDGVQNWEFHAPQTEEEVRDGADSVSFDIRNSKHILVANYHAYRVTRSMKPALSAARVTNSNDIRFRNVAVNGESGFPTCDENGCTSYLRASKYPYENAITDVTHRLQVRERMFAVLDYTGTQTAAPAAPAAPKVDMLEDGFYSIAGAAVDAKGRLYFIDRHFQHIFSYAEGEGLQMVSDHPLDPVNLAVDASGNLMVLSGAGKEATVYALKPGVPGAQITMVNPTPVAAHPRARGAAGELLAERRVLGPARSRHLPVHHARRDVRA
jgi:hypothetical protein